MHSLDIFYPDLKADNVVLLRKASGQAVGESLFELRLTELGNAKYSHDTEKHDLARKDSKAIGMVV